MAAVGVGRTEREGMSAEVLRLRLRSQLRLSGASDAAIAVIRQRLLTLNSKQTVRERGRMGKEGGDGRER
jgi:hypothetical protein